MMPCATSSAQWSWIRETLDILTSAAVTYRYVRDYGQGRAVFDRIIALEPKNILYRFCARSLDRVSSEPISDRCRCPVEKILTDNPALLRTYGPWCFAMALLARNPVAADRALAAITDNAFGARMGFVGFTRAYAGRFGCSDERRRSTAHASLLAPRARNRRKLSAHSPMNGRRAVLFAFWA